jgi:hypothetical protein
MGNAELPERPRDESGPREAKSSGNLYYVGSIHHHLSLACIWGMCHSDFLSRFDATKKGRPQHAAFNAIQDGFFLVAFRTHSAIQPATAYNMSARPYQHRVAATVYLIAYLFTYVFKGV